MKTLNIIGAGLGVGGFNHTSNDAPLAFESSEAYKKIRSFCHWLETVDERTWYQGSSKALKHPEKLNIIENVNTRIAELTAKQVRQHERFCVIGGDHSCAIGTWSGAASALNGDLGLIWVDAHMDAHTFETTYTQNIHGMPVATLLGIGHEKLTRILTSNPKIKPENLCLIGIRSFEHEESLLLKNLGVTIYTNKDIQMHSLETLLLRAHEQISRNTVGFGLSIDLDGFDPEFAPGTGTPVAAGIDADDFCRIISQWSHHPKLIGYEIAEFNSHLDKDNITENTIANIIRAFQQ